VGNAEFLNVKPGGIYSNHWALKGQSTAGKVKEKWDELA
jgi:hypothetical protein